MARTILKYSPSPLFLWFGSGRKESMGTELEATLLVYVASLASSYSVPMPDIALLPDVIKKTGKVAFYNIDQKVIVLDDIIQTFYEMDEEKAMGLARWMIAHEFYHYLVDRRRPLNLLKKAERFEEMRANLFAFRQTGITSAKFDRTFWQLEQRLKLK